METHEMNRLERLLEVAAKGRVESLKVETPMCA